MPAQNYRCSFCGKSQEQVRRLIAGPNGVYICNECIQLCNEILADEDKRSPSSDSPPDGTWQSNAGPNPRP